MYKNLRIVSRFSIVLINVNTKASLKKHITIYNVYRSNRYCNSRGIYNF